MPGNYSSELRQCRFWNPKIHSGFDIRAEKTFSLFLFLTCIDTWIIKHSDLVFDHEQMKTSTVIIVEVRAGLTANRTINTLLSVAVRRKQKCEISIQWSKYVISMLRYLRFRFLSLLASIQPYLCRWINKSAFTVSASRERRTYCNHRRNIDQFAGRQVDWRWQYIRDVCKDIASDQSLSVCSSICQGGPTVMWKWHHKIQKQGWRIKVLVDHFLHFHPQTIFIVELHWEY